ncbi:dipeptide/oligopeptide/nickel ABC transporter permease/ATP-binding protein [Streptosporangium amethystogenes]|uniref:dipeptide/oligopeptide/nickel ABC transporter permease/ATP-binding protein n=1 Tax=Streptosporangium amethystogenes TaxID=2002 RepID=UPI0004C88351|nr:dipeptide/oligopeptide/nickel ABC transporter permease/ATP-binding protein [Streptosporangium amethystogenes]
MRRLRSSPAGLAGLLLVTAFVVLAVIGPPLWATDAARIDAAKILQGTSPGHPLGTDTLGRDILARVLVAGRLSLLLAVAATLIGTVVGIPLGALPAVLPRRAGRFVVGLIGSLVAFPGLLLAMFTTIVLGLGARGAVFGIGLAAAPAVARLTHTLTASVAGSDYVAAARMLRVPRRRVLLRHILPNVAEPLILNITMILGSSLLGLAGLSFLGLGVQAPEYDWGRMLSEGLSRVYVHPEVALAPAVAIMAAGIGFHLLGESMARIAARESRHAPTGPAAPAPPVDVPADTPSAALELRGLTVTFPGGARPVRDVSLSVNPGEIVGIVGESGSGKSLTALAVGGLVPYPGVVTTARLALAGQEVNRLSRAARRRLLGTALAMVFQDPMSSLNPALTVGSQLAEVPIVHEGLSRRASWTRAVNRLRQVRIPDPDRRSRQRPHQFSGGMRQRAVIAMGLMGTPKLLIADEPTTALDVTVQRQVLELLAEVTVRTDAGVLFISHDMAVVSQICHRVVVMYAGRVVEELPVQDLPEPAHPYTRALVACLPDMRTDRDRPLATIPGRPPSPVDAESTGGCAFASRCGFATPLCVTERPPLKEHGAGRRLACWYPRSGPVREETP